MTPTVPPGLNDPERVALLTAATRESGEPLMLRSWAEARAAEGALFGLSHSGGKDSMLEAERAVRDLSLGPHNAVVVHADLHDLEWPGTAELARAHAEHLGLPFLLVEPYDADGARWDWFRKVDAREASLRESAASLRAQAREARAAGRAAEARDLAARARKAADASPFPSDGQRYCTSDLKTGPIFRELARYAAARGFASVVDCVGIRAEESDNRERFPTVRYDGASSGVHLYTWAPIQHVANDAPQAPRPGGVFEGLRAWREADPSAPAWHWAYDAGSGRLSCMFCIYLGRPDDLRLAALHAPELYARHVAAERRTGHSSSLARKFLEDITGLSPEAASARRVRLPLAHAAPPAPADPASTAEAVARVLGEGSAGHAALVARPSRTRHDAAFRVQGGELLVAVGSSGPLAPLAGGWRRWSEAERFARERLGVGLAVASASPERRAPPRYNLTPRGAGWAVYDRAARVASPGPPLARFDAEDALLRALAGAP